tara:strand:+ start:7982 stop:9115 length:1134 start_codon:yes stop_codon:yes gene_type:complete
MPKIDHLIHQDPTLDKLYETLEAEAASETVRSYIGASTLGHSCERNTWYTHRAASGQEAFKARTLLLFNDGHRSEAAMADYLRKIPGIDLWTHDDDGYQFGFSKFNRHVAGHIDGVIKGLVQAPTTPHIWEHKSSGKIGELRKAILDVGEKAALQKWSTVYYAQAQLYMHGLQMTRHYLTCSSPGVREVVSCRTEYNERDAIALLAKAERVIRCEEAPPRLSEDPSYYLCKFCNHAKVCHEITPPRVNCYTCAHATARLDGPDRWWCEHHNKPAKDPCASHRFNPHMMQPAQWEGVDEPGAAVKYSFKGKTFWNSTLGKPDHYNSTDLFDLLKDGNAAEQFLSDPGVAEIRKTFLHEKPKPATLTSPTNFVKPMWRK